MISNANIQGMLRDLVDNGVYIVVNAGAPSDGTSGTGAGLCDTGSLLINTDDGTIYLNTGTKDSPTWTISSGSGFVTLTGSQAISDKTLTATTLAQIYQAIAAAGTDQSNATAVAASYPGFVNVSAADGTKGIKLPATIVGMSFAIKNLSAVSQLKVYPPVGGLINGGATNAEVIVPPNAVVTFYTGVAGTWWTNPASSTNNIQSAAAAGANQGNAVAITAVSPGNILVTGADATKGARLPAAKAGAVYNLKNEDAANAVLNVYPATGGTINAIAANSPLAMAAKTSATFMCVIDGAWLTIPLLPS